MSLFEIKRKTYYLIWGASASKKMNSFKMSIVNSNKIEILFVGLFQTLTRRIFLNYKKLYFMNILVVQKIPLNILKPPQGST